jgi:hypothetical protein
VNEMLVLSMSGVTDSKMKDLTFEFGLCLEIVSHFSVTNYFSNKVFVMGFLLL